MQQIAQVTQRAENQLFGLGEFSSVIYHDIFDYPLTFKDLVRWKAGPSIKPVADGTSIVCNARFYYLEGKKTLILKRMMRERISARKMKNANEASRVISVIPTVNCPVSFSGIRSPFSCF